MDHKAYVFDWDAFERELAPVLSGALRTGRCDDLVVFINSQRGFLTDPYEGEPLPPDWSSLIETPDAHQFGDFALTKYYRASDLDGLADAWEGIDDRALPDIAAALLGETFGPKKNPFDPGKYGSYFQTPKRVRESIAALSKVRWPELSGYRAILKSAARQKKGLYVTF